MSDDVFGFGPADADALLKLIGGSPTPPPNNLGFDDSSRLFLAYTSGGATARVGTTLGIGTAVAYYLAASGSTRTLTASTDTTVLDYYNISTGAVASGAYIMLLRLGNDLICVWEEC